MNQLNPAKLLNSKWTAVKPHHKEKHFLVTEVKFDDSGRVVHCTIEAVLSRNQYAIDWAALKDDNTWLQGWK